MIDLGVMRTSRLLSDLRDANQNKSARCRCYSVLAILSLLVLTACSSTVKETSNEPDNFWPGGVDSTLIPLGESAKIEWLSFVRHDTEKYPELYADTMDSNKVRLRVAPKESTDRVMIEFCNPKSLRVWRAAWSRIEFMQAEYANLRNISIALCKPTEGPAQRLAVLRAKQVDGIAVNGPHYSNSYRNFYIYKNQQLVASYHEFTLNSENVELMGVVEWIGPATNMVNTEIYDEGLVISWLESISGNIRIRSKILKEK